MKPLYTKIVCIGLFATLLVSSTAIGFSSQKSARQNLSALSMGNVEALSDGETFNDILISVGKAIFLKILTAAGEEILEQYSDDGWLYCRWHPSQWNDSREEAGLCLPGHKISLRTGCGKFDKPDEKDPDFHARCLTKCAPGYPKNYNK